MKTRLKPFLMRGLGGSNNEVWRAYSHAIHCTEAVTPYRERWALERLRAYRSELRTLLDTDVEKSRELFLRTGVALAEADQAIEVLEQRISDGIESVDYDVKNASYSRHLSNLDRATDMGRRRALYPTIPARKVA